MKKVFLYLFPIKEFSDLFFLGNDFYDEINVKRPFDVMNEAIQKRYRDKGYQVIFAICPGKSVYGIVPQSGDKILYTNISSFQSSGYAGDGTKIDDARTMYPNEQLLINQLKEVQELVIGGYFAQDAVKRLGEVALENGISTLVDLDLTDLFFSLYRQADYFEVDSYDPERFKNQMLSNLKRYGDGFAEDLFDKNYKSPAFGFDSVLKKIK